MSARITYLLSQEECNELGHASDDVRDYIRQLDGAIRGAYETASIHVVYRFSRGVDVRVRVDGEGLDQDDVKRTVRELARRVFSGEIE
jgi:hypothetical protein